MRCPICSGAMKEVKDTIEQDKVGFTAYKCAKCGEELMNMNQLKEVAKKYRDLRKAREIIFTKWGNSLAVRIPKEFADELDLKEGGHGVLKRSKEGLEIIGS